MDVTVVRSSWEGTAKGSLFHTGLSVIITYMCLVSLPPKISATQNAIAFITMRGCLLLGTIEHYERSLSSTVTPEMQEFSDHWTKALSIENNCSRFQMHPTPVHDDLLVRVTRRSPLGDAGTGSEQLLQPTSVPAHKLQPQSAERI